MEWPGPLLPTLVDEPIMELLVETGADPHERIWHLRGLPEPSATWLDLFTAKDPPC